MRPKTFMCFAILLSTFVSINGKSSDPHFCEALGANNNQIDYNFNTPVKTSFFYFISIGGHFWNINYRHSSTTDQGLLSFNNIHGFKLTDTTFFDPKRYKCSFNIVNGNDFSTDKTIIGLLDENYRKVVWKEFDIKLLSDWIDKNGHGRRKRQTEPDNNTFDTGFDKIDYRPNLSFSTMTNLNSNLIYFMETTPDVETGSYRSRIQIYDLPDPKKGWTNETDNKLNTIPIAVRNVSSKYTIKGILPVQMGNSKNGSIILIEFCPTNHIPCPQTIVYKYCVVEDNEKRPTNDGKPCHQNNLKLFFDCTEWVNKSGSTSVGTTLPTTGGNITTEKEKESTPTETEVTETTVTPSPSKETKSGMGWLWILIILIIIIITVVIFLLFCCRSRKAKEDKEKPTPPDDRELSDTMRTKSMTSTVSARSGADRDGQSSQIEADNTETPRTPSTMSTVSNRSGVSNANTGQFVGSQGAKSGISKTPSMTSTVSTRSGLKNSGN